MEGGREAKRDISGRSRMEQEWTGSKRGWERQVLSTYPNTPPGPFSMTLDFLDLHLLNRGGWGFTWGTRKSVPLPQGDI